MIVTKNNYGNVTITGLDGTQTLQKSADGINWVDARKPYYLFDGTGGDLIGSVTSYVDIQPFWNWCKFAGTQVDNRHYTATQSGYAVLLPLYTGYVYGNDTEETTWADTVAITLDGSLISVTDTTGQFNENYSTYVPLWGKDFGTFGSHTIDVVASGGDSYATLEAVWNGILFADLHIPQGNTVYYKYGSEIKYITCGANRSGSITDAINDFVTNFNYSNMTVATGSPEMVLNTVSSLYALQPDSRLKTIADYIFNVMHDQCGSVGSLGYINWIPINSTDNPNGSALTTGRRISPFVNAYLVFKDEAYLIAAAKCATWVLNNWPYHTYQMSTTGNQSVWAMNYNNTAPNFAINHVARLIGAVALAVGQSDLQTIASGAYSSLYWGNLNTTLKNRLLGLFDIFCNDIPSDGNWSVYSATYCRDYQMFVAPDLVYASKLFGNRNAAQLNKLTAYMGLPPDKEPFFEYGISHTSSTNDWSVTIGIKLLQNGTVDQAFVDATLYTGFGAGCIGNVNLITGYSLVPLGIDINTQLCGTATTYYKPNFKLHSGSTYYQITS